MTDDAGESASLPLAFRPCKGGCGKSFMQLFYCDDCWKKADPATRGDREEHWHGVGHGGEPCWCGEFHQ